MGRPIESSGLPIPGFGDVTWVDVAATIDMESKTAALFLFNRNLEKPQDVEVIWRDADTERSEAVSDDDGAGPEGGQYICRSEARNSAGARKPEGWGAHDIAAACSFVFRVVTGLVRNHENAVFEPRSRGETDEKSDDHLLLFLAPGICWAQPPADCKPSSLNIPGAPYPCVFPDHRAMFRVAAPDAQKVHVRVGTGFDMAKEADGLWYVTTTPLVEGFHYYMINIDGSSVSDPATSTFFGGGEWSSAIEIPAADADFYSHNDVPHGLVRDQWYFSTVTQQWRRAMIYTPPDYDTEFDCSLSGSLPLARLGRKRVGLDLPGSCRSDHGQSDRRGQSETDADRDGQSERGEAWRRWDDL